MGEKTANGMDLWSIKLLKWLPMLHWEKLAQLLRAVETTGVWPHRIDEGFTSLVPKGEGGGDPMKLSSHKQQHKIKITFSQNCSRDTGGVVNYYLPRKTGADRRPLTVLSQVYRIWAGLRMEDVLEWQEQWAHEESYAFRPHRGSMDAAVLM